MVQILIFVLLLGLVQAILLTIFFLNKRLHRQGFFFLIFYISVMIFQITLKLLSKGWLFENVNTIYGLSYQLPFLYGPLIYLFIKSAVGRRKFQFTDLLHFVPFLMITIQFALPEADNSPMVLISLFFHGDSRLILQLVSLGVYHLLAYVEWRKYRQNLKSIYSDVQLLQLKWLKQFVACSLAICLLISVTIYLMYVFYPFLQPVRFAFSILTVFIYWISYKAMTQPAIFSVIKGFGNESVQEPVSLSVVHRPGKKYANSALHPDERNRIISSLQKLMRADKVYLNPEITIDRLASQVPCSRHHLSQVLNDSLKTSFYDYINSYRIEEAKTLLADPSSQNFKIASIAYDSGFNSLSAFNEVFKKFVGQTPSQFRKQPVKVKEARI